MVCRVQERDNILFHADARAYLEGVVVLEMSVVLHRSPRLVVGKCFGRQVILHSF
jgi:hypothetical protein